MVPVGPDNRVLDRNMRVARVLSLGFVRIRDRRHAGSTKNV
jgi:hypothetical protein